MRAIWTGIMSFGLVNIPIRLYNATGERRLKFHYLHKKDLSPIRHARICREDGREVPYEDIVRGYEYQKGDYIILTDEDFKKANLRKTGTIDIIEFAKEEEIDSKYFEKPYYLEPGRGADKAYALLREALQRSKKVGIARFVLKSREHLGIIKPEGDVIVLNQLRFKNELHDVGDLKLPPSKAGKNKEIELALAFIDQLTEPFKPEKYHDTYSEELEEVIAERIHGKTPAPEKEKPAPTPATDLMSILRESLKRARQRAS
ncbi:MAG: Ku domain protein [Candidatus Jettenia ecosi]|uniref:Non-homologous end joining protein Ku n=1 Tax=Candidatus Jettenia ecosi TaxID=2494326 RepID=A0A533QIL6_9BACT|nr:MAG: Ku domain protein [Candidatus Jettenia ecosi]